jgi:hypothetical protein
LTIQQCRFGLFTGEYPVRKIEVGLPILERDVMLTGTHMVADGQADPLADRRVDLGAKARLAEEFKDRLGGERPEELALGV